ncbi:hypothetical protein CDD82_2283 [Ophiocordyceps australis]|uniref:Major facilitator superfamily (MFS) profile domain-containing protein n=1 Tax=Ophiocordyceps australis TaxID=1399860 RepID=A0A2C5ZU11_9HYPO|nr:hypothetical protein CDD82_2283 [Ophiocordyceps australis]
MSPSHHHALLQWPDHHQAPDEPLPHSHMLSKAKPWQVQTRSAIVRLTALISFSFTLCGMLMLTPGLRLVEDAFCHGYYGEDTLHPIQETRCKIDQVQSPMAFVLAWCGLFTSVITLLVTFPYGALSDAIGRKPAAICAYISTTLSHMYTPFILATFQTSVPSHPYLLLPGSLFTLLGGGIEVFFATINAMAADVSSDSQKASHFLYLSLGSNVGALVGPLLAGLLMEKHGPWIPIYLVIFLTPLVLCLFLFLPETLHATHGRGATSRTKRSLVAQVKTHTINGVRDLVRSVHMIKDISILLVLVTFFLRSTGHAAFSSIMAQYVSKHFGWKLAETSLLLSPFGALHLVVLITLPRVSQMLTSPRFDLSSFEKDLLLTQLSTLLVLLGTMTAGLAQDIGLFLTGLFIAAFGNADGPLARATITHFVDAGFTSRLYGLIAISQVLGTFIAGPVLAWLFDQGLQRKGFWIGLPWYYVALLNAMSLTALVLVRPPKKRVQGQVGSYHDESD